MADIKSIQNSNKKYAKIKVRSVSPKKQYLSIDAQVVLAIYSLGNLIP
jgi:hypothetical protein